MAQVIEHLPSMWEALSSNPTITKKKKKSASVYQIMIYSIR
jgi:hypothetical protein